VAIDFLVVPTVSFHLLFIFVVLAHQRRHAIHFNVTAHPKAEWAAQQIAEAFPWVLTQIASSHRANLDCITAR